MKRNLFNIILVCVFGFVSLNAAENPKTLTIDEFVKTAVKNDEAFEEILSAQLALKYKKDLALPAKDLILSVKGQHEFYINQDRSDPRLAVSLSKLFPYTGTEISAEYTATPYANAEGVSSIIGLYFSQPIANNAFGKATDLQDKITGAETAIAGYQITEAYEDYLAMVIVTYYNWYSAFENLRIGNSSYEQSLKLLDNIKKRKKSSVALSIDVNKVKIQVLAKKENLIALQNDYDTNFNLIKKAIRYEGDDIIEPIMPLKTGKTKIAFAKEYKKFTDSSRTSMLDEFK